MNKYLKVIEYLVGFVMVIVLATFGYNFLTNNYSQDKVGIEDNTENLKKANSFEVLNIEGEKVNLSDFFGKPIVVNFWASWCEPCKMELAEFEEAYKKYQDVEFLMVNLTDGYNETVDSVKEFAQKSNYEFPLYFDTEYSAANTYNIYSIPQTLFINRDGEIVKSYTGMINKQTLEMYIEKIRGE